MDIEIKGLAELHRTLQEFPLKLEKNILRGAIRASAKPIVDEARRLASAGGSNSPHVISGALRKSIRARSVQLKNGMLTGGVTAGGGVSVGRGKGKKAADAYYARWVEFGHIARGPGQALKGGARSKKAQREALKKAGSFVPPRPYLRPAADGKSQAATDVFANYVTRRVEAGEATK